MGKETRSVNALELRIAFLAFPVGARDVHQLERGDSLGGRDVRASAEVEEFPRGVKRNHQLVGFFFHQLALKNLVILFVKLDGLGLGNEPSLVGQVLRRELVHFLFDFGQIFRREGLVAEKFVEEAGVDGRANAELDVGVEFHHGCGEQMRCGVTKDEEGVRIFFGEDLELDVFFERAAQIDQLAQIGSIEQRSSIGRGHPRYESGVGQSWRNVARDIRRSRAPGHHLNLAVRQCDLHLLHDSSTWKEKL